MELIEEMLTTDYIYLPYYTNIKLLIKEGEYVYKNDPIYISNTKKIYSTVSGKLLGLTTLNNRKYLVIENDYKEKVRNRTGSKKDISNYTKEELVNLIKDYNIVMDFDKTSKVLIINGIDLFNTEITYKTLIKEFTINILDTIDALIDIMNIKKCYVAISNDDSECINILVNNMGTYPKIDLKLIKNNNVIGNKQVLIDKLTSFKNKKYNIQYLNIIDILNIYNVLKKHIPITKTYITLTGDLLDYTKVLHINLGTNLLDILKEYNITNYDNVIVNGLLNGKRVNDLNFVIDNSIRSIYINTIKKYKTKNCINCGQCTFICPVNINPKYMYFNKDKKSKEYRSKCINCGMCSYICPAKINLNRK